MCSSALVTSTCAVVFSIRSSILSLTCSALKISLLFLLSQPLKGLINYLYMLWFNREILLITISCQGIFIVTSIFFK